MAGAPVRLRRCKMGCLGNAIWFLCGGLWQGLGWTLAGILWCVTIIGIPIGTQCFKFASLAFFPFGKEIEYGGGAMSLLANLLWLVCLLAVKGLCEGPGKRRAACLRRELAVWLFLQEARS